LLASVTASISWIRSARNFGGRCEPTAHDDGIIGQFEGYERLEELDWERYRLRYGNIQRLELILEAENDSANRYKASKQADVIMLFYLFSADELRRALRAPRIRAGARDDNPQRRLLRSSFVSRLDVVPRGPRMGADARASKRHHGGLPSRNARSGDVARLADEIRFRETDRRELNMLNRNSLFVRQPRQPS
jgi:hypothetical protein